jgi:hypothetical protein
MSDAFPFRIRCAWCREVIEEFENPEATSHGICPDCIEKEMHADPFFRARMDAWRAAEPDADSEKDG